MEGRQSSSTPALEGYVGSSAWTPEGIGTNCGCSVQPLKISDTFNHLHRDTRARVWLRLALRHSVLHDICVALEDDFGSDEALLATRTAALATHCPCAFAIRSRSHGTSLPMEVREAPKLQRCIMAPFLSIEAELTLKEWIRQRVGHLIQALATEGEVELLWRRMRWAFSDLPFFMAFVGLRALASSATQVPAWTVQQKSANILGIPGCKSSVIEFEEKSTPRLALTQLRGSNLVESAQLPCKAQPCSGQQCSAMSFAVDGRRVSRWSGA